MGEYLHINHGDDSRYEEFIEMLNSIFGFKEENFDFVTLLPKLYKEKYNPASSNAVLDVDGEMRACSGIFYNTLSVGTDKLLLGGIGNVGTKPEYQGRGYMRFIMAYCLDEMMQKLCDMSFLCGKRQRYEQYGYIPGGLSYEFLFTERNAEKASEGTDLPCLETRAADENTLEKMYALYERQEIKFNREGDAFLDILKSWRNVPYALFDGDNFAGYMVINEQHDRIEELSLTDSKYILPAVSLACRLAPERQFLISLPEYDTRYFEFFRKYSEKYLVKNSDSFAVFNFGNVLRTYLRLKSSYTRLADGEITVAVNGLTPEGTLKISVKDNVAEVREIFEKADVNFSYNEAMECFFSICAPSRQKLPPVCASWFPLPLYVPNCDTV